MKKKNFNSGIRFSFVASEPTDHTIEEGLMNVIWARGQEPGMYIHNPKTGLDTGKASVPDFYRPDELKYHGHGNHRGKVTMNFYGMHSHKAIYVPQYTLSLIHIIMHGPGKAVKIIL